MKTLEDYLIEKNRERDLEIYFLRKKGDTFKSIGERYALSATRISQIYSYCRKIEKWLNIRNAKSKED